MAEMIMYDCPKCGSRFERDIQSPEKRCLRCQTMEGLDVSLIIKELRKSRVPGQEPILRVIELLNAKIQSQHEMIEHITTHFNGLIRTLIEEEAKRVHLTDAQPN